MQKIMNELAKLGKEIDTAKTNISQLGGQRIEIVKRLKEDFGINTLEEAKDLSNKTESNLVKQEGEIQTDFDKLKEEFQW